MLPAVARELNLPYSNREGWLSGIFERVLQAKAPFELGVCFPLERMPEGLGQDGGKGAGFWIKGVKCYPFAEDLGHPEKYEESLEERFQEIFEEDRKSVV